MGTKHGYTEKKCVKCNIVKARSEFPPYGSRMCRECSRQKEAEAAKKTYEKNMKDERKKLKHQEKSREAMRRMRERRKKEKG